MSFKYGSCEIVSFVCTWFTAMSAKFPLRSTKSFSSHLFIDIVNYQLQCLWKCREILLSLLENQPAFFHVTKDFQKLETISLRRSKVTNCIHIGAWSEDFSSKNETVQTHSAYFFFVCLDLFLLKPVGHNAMYANQAHNLLLFRKNFKLENDSKLLQNLKSPYKNCNLALWEEQLSDEFFRCHRIGSIPVRIL